jgi:16S rRNA (cytosine967-C5)-methyltransferase
VNGQKPRQIAVGILGRRRPGGVFTDNLLERALAGARLSSADRRLCQELVYGIVRWHAALDWLVARKTDGRGQITGLQNLLRLGLYQIFWLDRIPPHAAVHDTVELAKQYGFGAQAGFVNALLRGYLREAEATRKLLADLKISRPALGFSHPEWLVEKWRARFGDEKTRQLLAWNNTPAKTFARANSLKADADMLLEIWRAENVEQEAVRRDWLEERLVFELKSHPPLPSLESYRLGWFYLQDPSTLLAAAELNPQPGETVLDLCAAPGGKATALAQRMQNQGRIVACDVFRERLQLLRENCARLGAACVEAVLYSKFKHQPAAFDRILVDAPCSNTGVLRRRVDLRWRITPREILRLRQTQLNLLKLAAPKLKPGGVLVYSTCSLEPEENAEVVKEFLAAHSDFKLENERELLPFADMVDGAYVARLTKLA